MSLLARIFLDGFLCLSIIYEETYETLFVAPRFIFSSAARSETLDFGTKILSEEIILEIDNKILGKKITKKKAMPDNYGERKQTFLG